MLIKSNKFLLPSLLYSLIVIGLIGCVPSPSLTEIKACEALNPKGECQEDSVTFQDKKQKNLFVSAFLKNAPRNISVRSEWKFNDDLPLTTNSIKIKESNDFIVSSFSIPASGWKKGKYTVIFSFPEGDKAKTYLKEFEIK
jgi:hypothetical protein